MHRYSLVYTQSSKILTLIGCGLTIDVNFSFLKMENNLYEEKNCEGFFCFLLD